MMTNKRISLATGQTGTGNGWRNFDERVISFWKAACKDGNGEEIAGHRKSFSGARDSGYRCDRILTDYGTRLKDEQDSDGNNDKGRNGFTKREHYRSYGDGVITTGQAMARAHRVSDSGNKRIVNRDGNRTRPRASQRESRDG